MSRPAVSAAAEEIYARLSVYNADDESYDWPLLRFVEAIASNLQATDDLVRDGEDGVGWSAVMDLDRVPAEALPWIAQFVGVAVVPELDDASQRERIRETAGFQRGTVAAIQGAARQYLTGNKTVVVSERDTSPYHLKVTTFAAETPVPYKMVQAVLAQKPAGLVMEVIVSTGASYASLRDTGKTYAQLQAMYPTPAKMKVAILV